MKLKLIFLVNLFSLVNVHSTTIRHVWKHKANFIVERQQEQQQEQHHESSEPFEQFDISQDEPEVIMNVQKENVMVCYYGSWAVYRPDKGRFSVEDIDPYLCTHLVYAFTGLSHDNQIRVLDAWNDLDDNYGRGAFRRFVDLKKINPKLKILIAIGGWNEGSTKYSQMAENSTSRGVFIDSVLKFLEKHGFDGLDLDWEYPTQRGGKNNDRENYNALTAELSSALKAKGYLLTAAVSAGSWVVESAYDVPNISKNLDLINIMTYDYHGGWDDKTGHNATLFSRPDEVNGIYSVNHSINYWISKGAAREKIVLGIATYGRSFTLDNEKENSFGASASQKGLPGPYTREQGSLGYNEICELQQRTNWSVVWNEWHAAPYAFKDRQWVGYDNVESVTYKTRFAKSMRLAGVMVWSLETDDFNAVCGEKNPLLNAIKKELANNNYDLPVPPIHSRSIQHSPDTPDIAPEIPTTTPISVSTSTNVSISIPITTTTSLPITSTASTTTTTTTTTEKPIISSTYPTKTRTAKPKTITTPPTSTTTKITTSTTTEIPTTSLPEHPDDGHCDGEGTFVDKKDCKKFYRCILHHGILFSYEHICPAGTGYDIKLHTCNWSFLVPNCKDSLKQYKITKRVYQIKRYYTVKKVNE